MAWFNPFEGGGSGSGEGSSTAYATSLVLELNPETYVLTATLKNKNGDTLGTSQTIDLPLETMVVSGRYDSNTKMVILVLSNKQEISFSVADLISGLQSEITIDNKLSVQLIDGLGTAALKDVPVSGNASVTQVVMGDDTRLTDARPASDVSAWAKALTKPSYSYSEITNTPTVDAAPASGSNNLVSSGGVYTALGDKVDTSAIGTAAAKNVPLSGNAASGECVLGSDTRLSDARPASDVSSWAKAENKPSYSYSEITGTPTLGTAAEKDVPISGNANATQVVLGNDGRLAWMDTNGDIYFGAKRIVRIMDEDSYKDIVDSGETENIIYCTYPTPTDSRSLSVNFQNSGIDNMRGELEEENEGISELEEPIEEEPIEEEPIEEAPPDDDMR